jgi:DNA repair exonuclease SbcCD nuclease subunit
MLALVFSDLHIHNYKEFSVGDSRLDNCLDVIPTVYKYCDRNEIKLVLFSGDLYHNQKMLPTKVINRTLHTFKECMEQYPDILFVAITGNHDLATKNLIDAPGETALSHLAEMFPERFILLDNSTLDTKGGVVIHGIPYYEYKEDFSTALDQAVNEAQMSVRDGNGKQILMIHQTPNKLGSDIMPADLDVDDPRFGVFDYVYCGHIHIRTQVTEKFLLVGNPQHKDLSDAGREKGFIVTDLAYPEDWRLVSTRNRYPEYKVVGHNDHVEEGTKDFIIRGIAPMEEVEQSIKSEDFSTALAPSDLITNYWKEVDGENKQKLSIGLNLVR